MPSRREFLKITSMAAIAWVCPSLARAVKLSPAAEAALASATLLYVATRRKRGTRSTIRPIWFVFENGQVFFTTAPTSWKARRLAKGSPLYIWVGTEQGPFVIGTAERVTDPAVVDHMGELYAKKYWIARLGFFRPSSARVAAGKTIAYRVSLEEGLTPPPPPAQ